MFGPPVSSELGPCRSALPVLGCGGQGVCRVPLNWGLSSVFLQVRWGDGDCFLDHDLSVGPASLP